MFTHPVTASQFSECHWKVWRTVRLGIPSTTTDEFCMAFKANGIKCANPAHDILHHENFRAFDKPVEVDLVLLSARELGLSERTAEYARVRDIALQHGLQLCPAEVGPQLRLQYQNQPIREWIIIAMRTITVSEGTPRMFVVGHRTVNPPLDKRVWDGLWLETLRDPDLLGLDDRIVFVLPRK